MHFQLKDGERRPGVAVDRQVEAEVIPAAWAGLNLAGEEHQVPWVHGVCSRAHKASFSNVHEH